MYSWLDVDNMIILAGMPTSATLSSMSSSFSSPARKATSAMGVVSMQHSAFLHNQGVMQPPTEDRYAALKDLDSLMKTQQASSEPQLNEWSTGKIKLYFYC